MKDKRAILFLGGIYNLSDPSCTVSAFDYLMIDGVSYSHYSKKRTKLAQKTYRDILQIWKACTSYSIKLFSFIT